MLGFFRKYQKIFFVITAFFIAVSFTFFGTYNGMQNQRNEPDRDIGKLIDGSILREKKLHQMKRFLKNGLEEGGRYVNLLNDSVIHKDIVLSGLGELLVENYFEELRPELEMRWKRMKNFAPYVHPHAPYISAEFVWDRFSPQIPQLLEEVKEAPEEFSKDQLPLMFKLYAAQAQFPPHFLHQMLYYQQEQSENIEMDPSLPHANMALFGFQSVEDWLGESFSDLVCQFIFNASHIASQHGYIASKEEVRLQLFQNIYRGMKAYTQEKQPSSEDVQRYFSQQVRSLGLDEDAMIELWSQVVAFRRQFEEVGNAVFLDSLTQNHFHQFAKSASKIRRYDLPEVLHFSDFYTLLKFQRYVEAVSNPLEEDLLALPTHFHPAGEVAQNFPGLVQKTFEVEMAKCSKKEQTGRVSLKETWSWEAVDENFAILQKEFPFLIGEKGQTALEILESLDDRTRWRVDQFAIKLIINEHPEWIDDALAKASKEKKTLHVRLQAMDDPFSGKVFIDLLEKEDESLMRYTFDGNTFYSIKVLEKPTQFEIVSFEEVNRDGTLDKLLDELLLVAHSEMEFEEPYSDMKNEIGAKLYADLLTDLEDQTDADLATLDDYAVHRFDGYLKAMRELAGEDSEKFAEKQSEAKWALVETEEEVSKEVLGLAIGGFSQVKNGSFFQLLENRSGKVSDEDLAAAKEMLSKDAKRELAKEMIGQIKDSHAIHLDIQ